jgi:hypothetical protein
MGSLAVAGAAVATTLSLQWLWARATARVVRRGRKGYSSIDAAKDAEVVKGAPWQPWGGSFQHCLKIILRILRYLKSEFNPNAWGSRKDAYVKRHQVRRKNI